MPLGAATAPQAGVTNHNREQQPIAARQKRDGSVAETGLAKTSAPANGELEDERAKRGRLGGLEGIASLTEEELAGFVSAVVAAPDLQRLWEIKDRGMPVFAHTVDVTLLCLDEFPAWRARHPKLDLPALVVGALLHDLSKLATHDQPGRSHTQVMSTDPGFAIQLTDIFLDKIAADHGLRLSPTRAEHVRHIVASHHGIYGKIPPRTPEATLVHRCDYYSASNHRLVPLDANDFLPLLDEGCGWSRVSARLGVSRDLIKTRLQESCKAEQVREWVDLIEIWRTNGKVRAGTPDRLRQLDRARLIVRLAHETPASLIERIRPLCQRTDARRLAAPVLVASASTLPFASQAPAASQPTEEDR